MPKTIKLEAHLSSEELEHHYREACDPVARSHYQIVWLLSEGKSTGEVMEVTGYCRGWNQQLARRYMADWKLWETGDTETRVPGIGRCSTPSNGRNLPRR